MSISLDRAGSRQKAGLGRMLLSPQALLALAGVLVCLLLAVPLSAPIGPMYWDVMIYYDAANRIFDGQAPVLDFFTPVGPLGYYIFAGWLTLFPGAQPTLIAHWSLLVLTAPLMALVVWQIDQRSRVTALALLLPFLIFALLPFNTREFYPYPGSDGFGIYNRQVCQVLYVLVAALLFVKNRWLLASIIAVAMTALFFLKITGFVAAVSIVVFAFLAGRVPLRHAVASALAFAVVLGGLELSTGIVSHYLADIGQLVEMNSGSLLPRFLQSMSNNFGIILPAAALGLLLLWADRGLLLQRAATAWRTRRPADVGVLFDHHGLWLAAVLAAGIFFETQNTGSQALIFLWPVLLAVLLRSGALMAKPKLMITVFALAAAAALPPAVAVVERAARTYVGAAKNLALQHQNLKTLGSINMRDEVERRVTAMMGFYPQHRDLYEDLTGAEVLPSPVFYSEFDFQVTHLIGIDRAISSIRALEAAKDVRFETIMSLNFVNPFPWLMDRSAPLHIAIGADPTRAVPDPGSEEEAAVSATDLVLYPTCPPTTANAMLYEMYASALTTHKRIKLDACYDAFVHPRLAELVD
ncbi:hypothetical protein [Arvimicrobium flavum]|uniref:hypothetical protein n=1 Tax=Arvimicrobium flavum TaxID=3393320 RepID=UPI00237A441E|nr:hypothetical protein [Mesorhizobium shangrilense]